MYLEQMFTASLYLWYLKWEEVATTSESAGRARLSMDEVPRPSLLDSTDEFASSIPQPPLTEK
jgi:hypothetical protein